jgi:spore maturation protein SpmB
LQIFSKVLSGSILLSIIVSFILMAIRKKVNVYDSFIDGAKDGFNTAIKIVPYLIAILVAIGVFRASGGMEWLLLGIKQSISFFAPNADLLWVDALPTAIMKPLSGSGARGMMVDTMKTYGPESFQGFLSCIFQGAADTTFFILAVYFGSIGIKKTRYALGAALFADLCGVIAAIAVAYIFYPK